MGMRGPFCDDDFTFERKLPNPNPEVFEFIRIQALGQNVVVEVKYPNCTNFEGRKIMVYLNTTIKKLSSLTSLDPHFAGKKDIISPFARFEPTDKGWHAAIQIATSM